MEKVNAKFQVIDKDDKNLADFNMEISSLPTISNSFRGPSGKRYKVHKTQLTENNITCYIREVNERDEIIG